MCILIKMHMHDGVYILSKINIAQILDLLILYKMENISMSILYKINKSNICAMLILYKMYTPRACVF